MERLLQQVQKQTAEAHTQWREGMQATHAYDSPVYQQR